MGKLIVIDDPEIVTLKAKIKDARVYLNTIRDIRKKCAQAYFREPLGTEIEGRADYVSSAVHNHVEGTMPALMKRNLTTDHKIKVKGPNDKVAKGLKRWVRERINDQGGFRLFNDTLKDGMIYSNGTAKVWWSRMWGKSAAGTKDLREEELASLLSDPEWTIESTQELPRQRITDIDYDDPVSPIMEVEGAQMYRVNCTYHELLESGPMMVPMPPEEFFVEKGKIRVNDRKGCGHIREMQGGELIRENEKLSTPAQKYYRNLRKAINAPVDTTMQDEKQERDIREAPYWDYSPDVEANPELEFDPKDYRKKCVVIEWADYIVSEGKFVPAVITFCNGEVIRAELNEDGIIPYCTWSPMVDPHSIYGHGAGWLHADDQNVQTVLTRAILDSVAFSIDKPRMIRSRSADLLGLQELTPGKLVVGTENDYKDIEVGELDFRILQAIEFLKGEGEERGPGTRYNMGTDAETLNATATGVSLIQRASLNKLDLISLAYSELFLVDLYNKIIYLAQQNLDKPVEVWVDGEKIVLTRALIQGDYRAEGDLGLEVDFDDRAYAKAQGQLAAYMQIASTYPMLAPVETTREYLKAVLIASGEKDLTNLLPPIPPMFAGWFPGREQLVMQMMQFQIMQMQMMQGGPPAPNGQPPSPGAPPQGGPGMIPSGGLPPEMGQTPEPQGRDFVSGQNTSQPDETMMEV